MWWSSRIPQHLPKAAGPFVPGCMDVMLDYSKSGIFMRLYYPTEAKKNDVVNSKLWISWIPDDSYIMGIAKVLMCFPFLIRVAFWWSAYIQIPVLYGAKPKTNEKLKCIIFSHGLGGNRFLYSNICCELASRGFLVAALEHRDCSASNTYFYKSKEDARKDIRTCLEHRRINLGKSHFEERNQQVIYRAEECCKALEFLKDVNEGKVPYNAINDVPSSKPIDFSLDDLVQHLDTASITAAGHSFGGATTLLALSQRNEFKQGILLDPWMFPIKGENLDQKLDQPLLFVNTQTFHIASNVDALSKFLNGGSRKMYTILHTTHENQSDSVLLVGYWLNWFMKKLNPRTALKINNAILLTFLDEYVNCPTDVQDCRQYLEEEKKNIDVGLTKPWA